MVEWVGPYPTAIPPQGEGIGLVTLVTIPYLSWNTLIIPQSMGFVKRFFELFCVKFSWSRGTRIWACSPPDMTIISQIREFVHRQTAQSFSIFFVGNAEYMKIRAIRPRAARQNLTIEKRALVILPKALYAFSYACGNNMLRFQLQSEHLPKLYVPQQNRYLS